jgi:hypothetical protein
VEAHRREREKQFQLSRFAATAGMRSEVEADLQVGLSAVTIYCLSNCTVGPVSLVPFVVTQSVRNV